MFYFNKKTETKILRIKTKIFADGADLKSMIKLNNLSFVSGLTTNPSLMKKAGIKDYEKFAKSVLRKIKKKPVSFEVFSDDHEEMYFQAKKISSWGENAYAKIPVCNTKKKYSYQLIRKLSNEGIKINITAIMSKNQIKNVYKSLNKSCSSFISIFAGRIADTGVDPSDIIKYAIKINKKYNTEIIWASTRELFNIFQCASLGCDIITVPSDIIKKLNNLGKNLEEFSLDTVKMFYSDATLANYKL
jgi:transaldolase